MAAGAGGLGGGLGGRLRNVRQSGWRQGRVQVRAGASVRGCKGMRACGYCGIH
ncbi:MAG: hypothetical protein ACPIOQ_26840 [Promethearchaeia archaeon]